MKTRFQKISFLLALVVATVAFTISPASALVCVDDPNDANYNRTECVAERLGFPDIKGQDIFIKQNPVDFIAYGFKVLLAIVVIIVVARIILAGITIANAKDDGDKRTDGFKKVINAIIGLVVASSSLGITTLIQNTFGADSPREILRQCSELDLDDIPQAIKDRCRSVQNS